MNTRRGSSAVEKRPRLLYLTNLYYRAAGRIYSSEDLFLTGELREDFCLLLCHPLDAAAFDEEVDGIIIRNTGPVLSYREAYREFCGRHKARGTKIFNSLNGQGDMAGKQYLLDLTKAQYPVIPTGESLNDLQLLPEVSRYIIKPIAGADSVGMERVSREELVCRKLDGMLIQPEINFQYEVSFFFINRVFAYALFAPNKDRRWELVPYKATQEDLSFARRFIEWNPAQFGIQRVDACRTQSGELLLMELEDLNPYLSLDTLDEGERRRVVETLRHALSEWLRSERG